MKIYEHVNITTLDKIRDRYQHLMPDVKGQKSMLLNSQELAFLDSMVLRDLVKHTRKQVNWIKSAVIFAQAPGNIQEMHVDGFDSSRAGACNWALNLPIAEVGIMAWFDGDYVLKETANGQGLGYLAPDWKGEYQIITSVAIDRPTIVKINIPHQVINHSDKRRLVLSMRFYPDIY